MRLRLKTHGVLLYYPLTYIIMAMVMLSGGIVSGYYVVESYKCDALRHQCDLIDRSLNIYAKMHKAVLLNSINLNQEKNTIDYMSTKVYPNSLDELEIIQDEQGYFSREIDFSQFTYSVSKKNDGSMTYKLGVRLPNGKMYISPQSNQE